MVKDNLENSITAFAEHYSLDINKACFDELQTCCFRYEIEECLCSVFENVGLSEEYETGTGPSEYLPELLEYALSYVGANHWRVSKIISTDNWMTANISLENNKSEHYEYSLNDVNESDCIPASFYSEFNEFARAYCEKSLLTFSSGFVRIIALPHQAIEDMEKILEHFSESM